MIHSLFPSNIYRTLVAACCLSTLLGTSQGGCSPFNSAEPQPGDVYSVDNGNGGYRIAKIVAADTGAVFLSLFHQNFEEPPRSTDTLSMQDSIGIHSPVRSFLPITLHLFRTWDPVLIDSMPVLSVEREEYRAWERAGRKVIG